MKTLINLLQASVTEKLSLVGMAAAAALVGAAGGIAAGFVGMAVSAGLVGAIAATALFLIPRITSYNVCYTKLLRAIAG